MAFAKSTQRTMRWAMPSLTGYQRLYRRRFLAKRRSCLGQLRGSMARVSGAPAAMTSASSTVGRRK